MLATAILETNPEVYKIILSYLILLDKAFGVAALSPDRKFLTSTSLTFFLHLVAYIIVFMTSYQALKVRYQHNISIIIKVKYYVIQNCKKIKMKKLD